MQVPGTIEGRRERIDHDTSLLEQRGADNRVWVAEIR